MHGRALPLGETRSDKKRPAGARPTKFGPSRPRAATHAPGLRQRVGHRARPLKQAVAAHTHTRIRRLEAAVVSCGRCARLQGAGPAADTPPSRRPSVSRQSPLLAARGDPGEQRQPPARPYKQSPSARSLTMEYSEFVANSATVRNEHEHNISFWAGESAARPDSRGGRGRHIAARFVTRSAVATRPPMYRRASVPAHPHAHAHAWHGGGGGRPRAAPGRSTLEDGPIEQQRQSKSTTEASEQQRSGGRDSGTPGASHSAHTP